MASDRDIEKVMIIETAGASIATPEPPDVSTSDSETEDEETTREDEFTPPDGGLLAWSQVFVCLLTNMMSWGYPATFGVYQLYYKQSLQLPEAQISWIGSVQIFLTFATCTFSGRLSDAGYNRSTVAVGAFLVVFGTLMTSLCTQYWQIFLAQGLCIGFGLGTMFMPPMSVASSYFKEKRSLALACAATGTGFGSVVFPAIIQYLIPRIGFPWAVRCSALVVLVISVVALLLMRPRLRPRKSGPLVEWDAFKELPYSCYTVGVFLFFWALYFGFFYVSELSLPIQMTLLPLSFPAKVCVIFIASFPPADADPRLPAQINGYARNVIGFSTTDSVQLLLITNGMSVPARPVCGYLADRWTGPINMFASASAGLGVMIFAWAGVHDRVGMYVFSVFFGLANGAAQGVFGGSLASLTRDPRKMGTRFGMVCTVVAFGTLAGPPTAGAIIDRSGGRYLNAQVWAGLVILCGSVMFLASRIASTGFKLRVKI